jgi:hypothetical protein
MNIGRQTLWDKASHVKEVAASNVGNRKLLNESFKGCGFPFVVRVVLSHRP